MMGHNEFFTPDKNDRVFLQGFNSLRSLETDMAGTKGDMSAVYARLKAVGWSKKDIEFAKSLEDKDEVKVVADLERKIRIAKMFGHRIGRQFDLLDADRTPIVERAFQEGYAAGARRKQVSNPYLSGPEMSEWQRGYNEGTEFVNADLDEALSSDAKADGDDEADEADDAFGGQVEPEGQPIAEAEEADADETSGDEEGGNDQDD